MEKQTASKGTQQLPDTFADLRCMPEEAAGQMSELKPQLLERLD